MPNKLNLQDFFKDKQGHIVIGQRPNLPIVLAFSLWVASFVAKSGLAHDIFYGLFLVFLTWWAVLELLKGVNYFRKFLGMIVLVFIAYKIVTIFT
jgi:hypothetical protein